MEQERRGHGDAERLLGRDVDNQLELRGPLLRQLRGLLAFEYFFVSSRRRQTRFDCDWSSDVCSSDLDDFDYDSASLVQLAILLEDAIDMHDRHWSIHWVLNFAQFSSTLALNAAIAKAKGEGDHSALMGRLQSSTENRNWDSIEELWKIKEWIKAENGAIA